MLTIPDSLTGIEAKLITISPFLANPFLLTNKFISLIVLSVDTDLS